MLPKSETNGSQNKANRVIESMDKTAGTNDVLPKNSIATGISILIYLFKEILIFILSTSSYYSLILIEELPPRPPTLLAWSSQCNNKISIVELETKREFASFDGVKLIKVDSILLFPIINSSLITF